MIKKYILFYVLFPLIGLPTIGLTWFFWSMPSPEVICQKTAQITSQKKVEEQSLTQCIKTMAEKKDISGIIAYRKEARCIMKAETIANITACRAENSQ